MNTVVGLDPAINSPGVAVLRDGKLVAAWNVKTAASMKRLPMGERIQAVAGQIVLELRAYWRSHICFLGPGDVGTYVYECPQIYGVGVSKVDPNNLIMLAEVGAAVAAKLEPAKILRPTPREWTAGTSKNTDDPFDSSRWRRIAALLTPEEVALVPEQHDAIDGAGLALHATDRALALPRRVFPGASPRRK